MTNLALINAYSFRDLPDTARRFVLTYMDETEATSSGSVFNGLGEYINDDVLHHFDPDVSPTLLRSAPSLRAASQTLYDEIQGYLLDVPDSALPQSLVAAFDALEAAWREAD